MLNIFEKPWLLLIVAVVSLLITLIIRRIIPEKKNKWQLLLPTLIAISAFGLDFFIRTDLEKINMVISTAVRAVEQEDCNTIKELISENYSDSYHPTKNTLLRHCTAVLSKSLIKKNIKRVLAVEISGPKAIVTLTVRIIFDKRGYAYQSYQSEMLTKSKLELQQQDDRWLINRVEVLEINRQPIGWRKLKQISW